MASPPVDQQRTFRCVPQLSNGGRAAYIFLVAMLMAIAGTLRGPMAAAAVIISSAVPFYLAFVRAFSVELAADGVLIKRFGRQRFIPYTKIRSVETRQYEQKMPARKHDQEFWSTDHSVVLELTSGRPVEIGTGFTIADLHGVPLESRAAAEQARRMVRLLRDRIREDHPVLPLERELARNGQSLEEWKARLVQIARPGDGYREATVSNEALLQILEDGKADPSARAGAAFIVGKQKSVETTRVRVALDDCASPKVRIALEAALEENAVEEERWDAALREFKE